MIKIQPTLHFIAVLLFCHLTYVYILYIYMIYDICICSYKRQNISKSIEDTMSKDAMFLCVKGILLQWNLVSTWPNRPKYLQTIY